MIQNNFNIILEDSTLQAFESLTKFKESPYFGAIVIGRPGTGKTALCQYFAQIHDYSHLYFNSVNEFHKEGEANLGEKIQNEQNKMVFFDEVEYFTFVEQEKYYKFLEIIKICQQQHHKVVFITQSPERLDLLPSKLPYERCIGLILPETKFRQKFMQQNLPQFQFLIQQTDCYSIADLVCLLREIQMEPIRKIMNAKFFKSVDGKYKINTEGEQLKYEDKLSYLNDGLLEVEQLKEEDVRRVLSNWKVK